MGQLCFIACSVQVLVGMAVVLVVVIDGGEGSGEMTHATAFMDTAHRFLDVVRSSSQTRTSAA
jgi:thymidylate kinase